MQADEFLTLLGQRVKDAREAEQLSQDALAAGVGYTRSSIANIEAGTQDPPVSKLFLIAVYLKQSFAGLVGLSGTSRQR